MKKAAAISLSCCAVAGVAAWQIIAYSSAKAKAQSKAIDNSAKIKDNFWRAFIAQSTAQERELWQAFLSQQGCSSHMWVVCQCP